MAVDDDRPSRRMNGLPNFGMLVPDQEDCQDTQSTELCMPCKVLVSVIEVDFPSM